VITFGHLLQRTKDFDGKVGTSYSHDIYADAVREAVREVWYAHDWQFHTGELVLPLLDGYSAGTVTVTNGSTKVTASSSATWATSWAKARFIRDGDDGDYTMKTFRESGGFWVGTLDAAYHFSTGSTQPYSLQFMEYDLPSDFLSLENPTRGTLFGGMAPSATTSGLTFGSLTCSLGLSPAMPSSRGTVIRTLGSVSSRPPRSN
jgi:hypothetical protein